MDTKKIIFKKFFKNSNNNSPSADDSIVASSSAVRTMTPSSPGFNPPKFSFGKKKFDGNVFMRETESREALNNTTAVAENEVPKEQHLQANSDRFDEYPDDLFDSLIERVDEETDLTTTSAAPAQLESIEEEPSKSNTLSKSNTMPVSRHQLHEPKPVLQLNGNRLIVQLTAFAARLDSFKDSIQSRQNSLDLALLGLDEKLAEVQNFNLDMLLNPRHCTDHTRHPTAPAATLAPSADFPLSARNSFPDSPVHGSRDERSERAGPKAEEAESLEASQ